MKNSKRYAIVMVISIIFNTVFYLIAHFAHLPLWMDLQGTAFAAFLLEPAAGLIVGLVNNLIEAIFFYDASSLIYYGVSASVALIVGIYMKKEGKLDKKRFLSGIALLVIVTSTVTTLLSIWQGGGVPDSGWEFKFYKMALDAGVPQILCSFFGVFVLKFFDAIVGAGLCTALYWVLPKSLRQNHQEFEVLTFEEME